MSVKLRVRRRRMFVGSYAPIRVEIDPFSGLTMDDLMFIVDRGPAGGIVSMSRESSFDPQHPEVMLLAGFQPGAYLLQAFEKANGTMLGQVRFTLSTQWEREMVGPSRWFGGRNEIRAASSAWGGGPAGAQNLNVVPAIGVRRVAVLLVDTASERFTTDAAALQGHRDRWMSEVMNGVTTGGVTRSVAHFFREVSYGNFDVSAQVFGPVSLSTSWEDNFKSDGSPKGAFYQACITAGDSLINYGQFDTVVCVTQSVPAKGTDPAKSAWPYASIGSWGPYATADGHFNLGLVSMPNEWGTADNREIHETLAHEIGHNLGLIDQYTPGVPGRNVSAWDLMHFDDPLPHLSLVHRMMLGWIPADWLQLFNFSSLGAAVDQPVTLHPLEAGSPAADRRTGIEVRLADGWNYYFEYRIGQAAHIGDRNLPADSRVLGTDAVSAPWTPPILRPSTLLLNSDIDGDGAVLGNNQDYEERDSTDPMYPTDFTVDVSGIDGSKADIRVRYGVNTRPDPSIRPWPAGPGREWQSPDIEIRNDRNAVDPNWFNVPWDGNRNTVVATVKNNSSAIAPGVRVNFYVKNFNVGGAPETFLGSDVRDLAANATVEFSTTWVPPSEGHYCVVARIPLYQVPSAPSVVELTELNNLAQSNYDRFISRTGSPGSREITTVEVGNPYSAPTRIFLIGNQNNPVYRTYIEHSWLWLQPGETRGVRVMFEYAPTGDEQVDEASGLRPEDVQEYATVPNEVGIHSVIEDPRDVPTHAQQILGGAQVQVVTGRATRFEDFGADPEAAWGTVVAVDDGSPVPEGTILIKLSRGEGLRRYLEYRGGHLVDGAFRIEMAGEEWGELQAYYLPVAGYADCNSIVVPSP